MLLLLLALPERTPLALADSTDSTCTNTSLQDDLNAGGTTTLACPTPIRITSTLSFSSGTVSRVLGASAVHVGDVLTATVGLRGGVPTASMSITHGGNSVLTDT